MAPLLTGELESQIDRIWDAFWSGGISNPLEKFKAFSPGLADEIRAIVDRCTSSIALFRSTNNN